MAKIYIENGRIVATETNSQISGRVPDGVYVRIATPRHGTDTDVRTSIKS